MKIRKVLSVVLFSLFVVFAAISPLQAATISTHAGYVITTLPPEEDNDSGSSGTVYSHVSIWDGQWEESSASAVGDTNGNTAAYASYIGLYGWDYAFGANVEWTNTYTIDTPGAYTWDFSITDGELSIKDWCYGPIMTAHYDIEIFVDGASAWNSSAILSGGMIGYTYMESGTDIGGILFGDDGSTIDNYFGYTYDNYEGSIALGSYNSGDTLELMYVLSVGVEGPGYETGASAFFGDPGDLEQGVGIQGSLNIVPIPGALWLIGSGFLALVGLRRKFSI